MIQSSYLTLKKLSVEGFNLEINFEAIFRYIVIAYLILAPATDREQSKLPDKEKPEIKITEQIPTPRQNKPNSRRAKQNRRLAGEDF